MCYVFDLLLCLLLKFVDSSHLSLFCAQQFCMSVNVYFFLFEFLHILLYFFVHCVLFWGIGSFANLFAVLEVLWASSLLIISALVMAPSHITFTWRMCHPFFLDAIVWGLLVNKSQFIVNLSINVLSSLILCNFFPVFSLEAVVSSLAAKQQRQY